MATILLQAAGGALGGLVGGPVGAMLGRGLGALAGGVVDQRLFSRTRSVEGARLRGGRVLEADEGAGIARLYGTARIAGQAIWATRFEETRTTERQGGKGRPAGAKVTTYSYHGNLAIGLCEGPIAGVRRVWADGEELDLTTVEMRVHRGTEDQMPDPLIEARQGAGNAPAYRGLAYVVFERLALERWGNRLPQIACEVIRPIGEMEEEMRAVTIIPGASEHGLDPVTVRERLGPGTDRLANRNVSHSGNDFAASLDELTALCPKLERAALIVAWFADDLRCGRASVRPGVEVASRAETVRWSVDGIGRGAARLVSRSAGGPAYGGTPSDEGVVRSIRALKARGLKVTHYPFLLMDVPAGNGLPDPHGDGHQPAYPWRGRMSLDVAENRPGTADRTATARADIERFVFGQEWSYRRMVLHQAALCAFAGGVDAFVIGSEMRGLTRLRDEEGRFPFVEALIALAREVKAILPGATITYAADWSEYFGYQPADGSGDVFYNLDPLWAEPAIGVVGIDSYLPLTDWRGADREDGGPDGLASPYDRVGLAAGIESGEHYDWYYASEEDRRARRRTPITDGAAGKPWIYRAKDLRSWWENEHRERRGGVEVGGPSPWVPRGKPIWLTELGCPAIDKGANQPNVFVDPKSSESFVPHFSTGARDDHQQRRFIEAHLRHWAGAANPVSPVYGGPMVEPGAVHLWTWDARPYPAFPERRDVWSDGGNWALGHWLTGRLGKAPLARLIQAICRDHGFTDVDTDAVDGEVGGFVLAGPGSARGEIEALMRLGGLTATTRDGRLTFASTRRSARPHALAVLAQEDVGAPVELRRAEASEGVDEAALRFSDRARAYQSGTASAGGATAGRSSRRVTLDLPVTLDEAEARRFAANLLADSAGGRETARFALSPTELAIEPGDVVTIPDVAGRWRVERIEDGAVRRIEARILARPGVEPGRSGEGAAPVLRAPPVASRPAVELMDLPPLGPDAGGPSIAVFARPFVPYAAFAATEDGELTLRAVIDRAARLGQLAEPLAPGPEGRLDRANAILVDLPSGGLASIGRPALLAGGNLAAVRSAGGIWEVLQFETAEEVARGRFRLTGLLRGQAGTEDASTAGAPAGAAFVLLDEAVVPAGLAPSETGQALRWRVTPAGRPLDDDAAVDATQALGARALLPLSPVHLRARFEASGALGLRWVRRSRVEADRWEAIEIPIGEEVERYGVDIRGANGARIAIETGEPAVSVPGSRLDEAFGPGFSGLDIAVAQISLGAGPGTPRRLRLARDL